LSLGHRPAKAAVGDTQVYDFAHGRANPQTVDRQEQAKLPQLQRDTHPASKKLPGSVEEGQQLSVRLLAMNQ